MIDALISSKTRIKLLLKFFLNSHATAYLRSLESEFGESSNGIRLELNRLEKAGLLCSESEGNKKIFRANTTHPLFSEIHNIVMKHIGLDQVVENVIRRLGDVQRVYLVGDFSKGINSQVIDLIFIGDFDKTYLTSLVEKAETIVGRKIRYLIYHSAEADAIEWNRYNPEPLLLWSQDTDSPHIK
ncbi:MAG: ArsR family transcriptional regulator [Saprospiraceae bacterium]|nr:ArsR family transcriptional regulator [Saprospiraceae bacterium]MCB0574808.1 ArsR family transcriptional regulator [Saprospiraceae bacterium]MCB9307762.1 ArsR family transcriptional regulator [Lewinellaceae bacterium]MCB9356606.1 ArsR family transcriptional regulator [Lewinellaceae bacterium]